MRSKSFRALIAFAVVACLGLVAAVPARAGTYRAALCNPDLAAFHADASFERNSQHYLSATSCGIGGKGLVVSRSSGTTRAGAWGAWAIRAPTGTAISAVSVKAAGRARGGHRAELLAGPIERPRPFATVDGALRRFSWSGGAGSFAARLRCGRPSGCRRARGSRLRVKRVSLILGDAIDPNLGLDGSLFAAGSRRGAQSVVPLAADVGSGIHRFLLQVNGEPVTARTVSCHLADGIAIRLQPCPGRTHARFDAATDAPPFRQGPNLVRVCAADYARTTAANRSCAKRRVRIDNLCPLASAGGAALLRARLRRHGAGAVVAGRLLDRGGVGVPGARVCVAARLRLAGAAERVAVTPVTGSDGRFRASIPDGPSRQVRVAYWPSARAALERYLRLDVPARPRLRLRPGHPVPNRHRVRFQVRLPGPRRAGRRVRVQARAGRRWLDVRSGLTSGRGIFRARYRFHATTARRTYRFRAVVPKQRGYPYEAGTSRVKRVTVTG
jgi:hypothetical protein